jgi:hypothetical protein
MWKKNRGLRTFAKETTFFTNSAVGLRPQTGEGLSRNRVTRKKVAQKVAKQKIYNKVKFESPKHTHQTIIETLSLF